MTVRIDLIPSSLDRLDPVARIVRWWTTQMTEILGVPPRKTLSVEAVEQGKRLPARTAVVLPDADVFTANVSTPKGMAEAHRQALQLRLNDLAPVAPEKLVIAATAVDRGEDGSVTYTLAMARRERLDTLDRLARRKGARRLSFQPEGLAALDLKSPSRQREERRDLIVDAALIAAVLISALAAVMSWTAHIEAETVQLVEHERDLRRAAIAYETARRDGELARDFSSRGVLDRRAGAVLKALADLNAATPAGAWWTSVQWSTTEIVISAQANDAAKAIDAISNSAKAWSIELSGPISTSGSVQTFDLKLRPRPTGASP
jgi:hypothetical protein